MSADWKKINVSIGSKLFKIHNFTFMHNGANYELEIDEFQDGSFSGHGEHATDKNSVIASVSGSTFEGCLESLINNIKS